MSVIFGWCASEVCEHAALTAHDAFKPWLCFKHRTNHPRQELDMCANKDCCWQAVPDSYGRHADQSCSKQHVFYSQQEVDVALTRVPLATRGFSSRSLGSLWMPSPQGAHVVALGSEYINQFSLKVPSVQVTMLGDRM